MPQLQGAVAERLAARGGIGSPDHTPVMYTTGITAKAFGQKVTPEGVLMTSSTTNPPGAPLGVGSIIGESFSILFGNFIPVLLLSLGPTLLNIVISGLLNGWNAALGMAEPVTPDSGYFIRAGITTVVQLVLSGVTTALLVQMAYDAKLQRPLKLGQYFGPALSAAVPIAILGIGAGILTVIGFIALIIPGLWIYAVYSMMPAAVVIEKVGFGGLGRSAALTKDYRWPIVGAFILLVIIGAMIGFVAMFLVGLMLSGTGISGGGLVVAVLILALVTTIGAALGSISVALIYARLREIKEGASVRDIASVFD